MGHDPKQLQAVMQRAAPPDMPLGFRPMFGGIMAYCEGKPFASLSNVGLALKLAGGDHTALLAEEGASALRYEPDQPASKSYVVVPPGMLADLDRLRHWIVRSAAGLVSATSRSQRSLQSRPRTTRKPFSA